MVEYLPIVSVAFFVLSSIFASSSYALDAFLSIMWLILCLFSCALLIVIREKAMTKKHPNLEKKVRKHKLFFGIIDWVDAIAQAACIVLLLQFFVFQLYLIPSESMVPTFMIGDRVVGTKFMSGPAFPLSSFRFPKFREYKRGDVVILRNPNYDEEPNNDLKFFTSQLIQILTLTMVNINKDKDGKIKTDPLVKRIVALPHEKLMLVDGVLYIKKEGDKEWKVQDEKSYVLWNVDTLSKEELKYVKDKKVDSEFLSMLEGIEIRRKNFVFNDSMKEAEAIVDRIKELKESLDSALKEDATEEQVIIEKENLLLDNIILKDLEIATEILSGNGGDKWFSSFMLDWISHWQVDGENVTLYEKRFSALNALIKISIGKLILRDMEMLKDETSQEELFNDALRLDILSELKNYYYYLALSGQRNMNEFPSGEGNYIPESSFFMMGDNRFNSTDMRHSYKIYKTQVDKKDPSSIMYFTNINPRYVRDERILGTASFVFWPKERIGRVK